MKRIGFGVLFLFAIQILGFTFLYDVMKDTLTLRTDHLKDVPLDLTVAGVENGRIYFPVDRLNGTSVIIRLGEMSTVCISSTSIGPQMKTDLCFSRRIPLGPIKLVPDAILSGYYWIAAQRRVDISVTTEPFFFVDLIESTPVPMAANSNQYFRIVIQQPVLVEGGLDVMMSSSEEPLLPSDSDILIPGPLFFYRPGTYWVYATNQNQQSNSSIMLRKPPMPECPPDDPFLFSGGVLTYCNWTGLSIELYPQMINLSSTLAGYYPWPSNMIGFDQKYLPCEPTIIQYSAPSSEALVSADIIQDVPQTYYYKLDPLSPTLIHIQSYSILQLEIDPSTGVSIAITEFPTDVFWSRDSDTLSCLKQPLLDGTIIPPFANGPSSGQYIWIWISSDAFQSATNNMTITPIEATAAILSAQMSIGAFSFLIIKIPPAAMSANPSAILIEDTSFRLYSISSSLFAYPNLPSCLFLDIGSCQRLLFDYQKTSPLFLTFTNGPLGGIARISILQSITPATFDAFNLKFNLNDSVLPLLGGTVSLRFTTFVNPTFNWRIPYIIGQEVMIWAMGSNAGASVQRVAALPDYPVDVSSDRINETYAVAIQMPTNVDVVTSSIDLGWNVCRTLPSDHICYEDQIANATFLFPNATNALEDHRKFLEIFFSGNSTFNLNSSCKSRIREYICASLMIPCFSPLGSRDMSVGWEISRNIQESRVSWGYDSLQYIAPFPDSECNAIYSNNLQLECGFQVEPGKRCKNPNGYFYRPSDTCQFLGNSGNNCNVPANFSQVVPRPIILSGNLLLPNDSFLEFQDVKINDTPFMRVNGTAEILGIFKLKLRPPIQAGIYYLLECDHVIGNFRIQVEFSTSTST